MSGGEPIEEYLDQLLTTLAGTPREVRRTLAEAEQHLHESAHAFEAQGMSRPDAEGAAVQSFGSAAMLARGFGRLRIIDLVRPAVGFAALGLIAIGLSGVIAEVMGRLWGAGFVAGNLPGTTYTPARCSQFQESFPSHGCLGAATLHHWGEVVDYRIAAGVLGLLLLAAWRLLPRRRALPAGYLPLAGLVAFGGAAAALVLGTANASGGGWSGAGQWLSAAMVSVMVAAAFGIRTRRDLRPPSPGR